MRDELITEILQVLLRCLSDDPELKTAIVRLLNAEALRKEEYARWRTRGMGSV